MFLSQPCVCATYSAADRRLARAWFDAGIHVSRIEQAVLLGCGRKYASWLNGQPSEPIGSLAFFESLLEELSAFELSVEYQSFNRYQVEKYKQKWLAVAASPGSSPAARAGATVAQAKAGRKTETR